MLKINKNNDFIEFKNTKVFSVLLSLFSIFCEKNLIIFFPYGKIFWLVIIDLISFMLGVILMRTKREDIRNVAIIAHVDPVSYTHLDVYKRQYTWSAKYG